MKLIGMLDSPYVRRVAICLDLLGVPFEHEAVSVFSTFERFQRINPVVKAPTLVCEDGGILMDSALILQYVETEHHASGSPLWSPEPRLRLLQFRAVAFASAAADKVVQFVYEKQLRPAAAQYQPWQKRVHGQFTAAFTALEALLAGEAALTVGAPNHASLWAAIVWPCARTLIPGELPEARYPRLALLSEEFEATPLFRRWPPDGPGVPAGSA